MSITEHHRGQTCPHGSTYGVCPSSMCHIWTVEEVFEDQPKKVEVIRNIERLASAELGMEVYFDFPVDQEKSLPHPMLTSESLCFTVRGDKHVQAHTCGKLYGVLYSISAGCDYEVAGSYIGHVLMNPT